MVKVFLLIVVGLAGDPAHKDVFHKWGTTLAESAEKLGVTGDRLVYLVDEPAESDKRVTGPATQPAVTKALETFAAQAGPDDVVFVMLIGHGDSNGKEAKFNLKGPDMTSAAFKGLIEKMRARQIVFVNTTSASGPFMADLSGPGRMIVTATRNGAETYDTLFGGVFIEALTSEAADADKNRRISVLEAFLFAKGEVERAYKREGLLMTEHAMLDDNGDKEGSQAPSMSEKDGRVASVVTLATIEAAGPAVDPKIAALYTERREMERRVENLRLLKDSMEPAVYARELETLATDIARKTREIRAAEAAAKK